MERKKWIDNLRWGTILLVVIFHVFYYYNNIGVDPMFNRLAPNPSVEGEKAALTFAGFMQYAVYQWFMLLLFLISGICAKYTLQKKKLGQFMKERTRKILVPSTLGVITIQWIGGWIITNKFMKGNEAVPVPVRYLISVLSGTGALWFCHVLFVACVVLVIIKSIDKKGKLEKLGEKANIFVALALVIIMILAAQFLNVKTVPTYRMLYYPLSFLFGYYVFSSEKVLEQLKKYGWICLIGGVVAGVFYFIRSYGFMYSMNEVQNNYISIIHAWLTMMGIIGVAQTVFDFENKFTVFMNQNNWGIYVNHILIMLALNTLLEPIVYDLPVALIYIIELIVTLLLSIGFYHLFKRIPVLRYVLYGIKGKK